MCPNDCRNLAGLGPDYDKNCWDREHCQIGKYNNEINFMKKKIENVYDENISLFFSHFFSF